MLGTDLPPSVAKPALLSLPLARFKFVALALASFALLTAAWYGAQVYQLDYAHSAAIESSISGSAPLRPEQQITVTARGAGVQLETVQLYRADVAEDGSRSAERPIPIQFKPANDDSGVFQVVANDGQALLGPDGAYRLTVRAAAPRPAIPLPRTDTVERQYRFATIASPKAAVPSNALEPRWGEPVSISFSEPMQSVRATVEPQTSLTTWIDQSDPRKAWFQVGDDVGAQTFQIRVAQAQARTGIALQKPVIFKLQTPPKPRFVDPPQNPVTLKYGDSFTIKSSLELTGVQVTTSDPSLASVAIDKSAIRVTLPRYQQGAAFDVSVPSAASLQGAPLAEPLNLHFVTPPAMDVPSIAPDDGTVGVQPNAHPAIEFPEPVADQGVATQALQMDPQVAGRWQWTSPTRVEFVPDTRLPILSDITVSLRGGPDGPRNAAGGYLADDVSATFRTTDFKRMDVSLGRQTMTLFENDVAVRTIYVATGVAAAPTPTGTFYVQYKSPQMRFRGVNPDGSHYDIPDVHWVMPFWGDYTIHGAYWRPRFGVPGSDGCISMTDGDAKMLFDWADVGTPVVIHS